MSKKALFGNLTSNGANFGRKLRDEDLNRLQNYAHEYTARFISDLLSRTERSTVGFDYSATGGNSREVTISGGTIYDASGIQYVAAEAAELIFDEASESSGVNRIDAVVAVLEENVAADNEPVPVQQIRTQEELEDAIAPYIPTQLPGPQSAANIATIVIRKGADGAVPVAPTLASNEVLLYLVAVTGTTLAVRTEDFVDARPTYRTQREQDDFLDQLRRDLEAVLLRVVRLETIDKAPIDFGGEIRSLREILISLQNQLNALRRVNPEIMRPGLALADPMNGKLVAAGTTDNSVPCVDVELGSRVIFAAAEHFLTPSKFADQDRNPRLVQIDGGPASANVETALNLAGVTEISSDGQVAMNKRAAQLAQGRLRPGVCSRGAQAGQGNYVEIYGGTTSQDFAHIGLSTWQSYDTVNDVLTTRTVTGTALPAADNPWLFPYGDGKVLAVAGKTATTQARWFRVNVTGANCVSTELVTGSRPQGNYFFGDKISDDKIFIVAQSNPVNNTPETKTFWLFDTTTELFSQINPSGNLPNCPIDLSSGCFYREGHFALVEFNKLDPTQAATTFVFELASLTWRQLNIPSPYQPAYGVNSKHEYFNRSIYKFRMANVAGRIFLVSGGMRRDYNIQDPNSLIWELKVADYLGTSGQQQTSWDYFWANYPINQDAGFCSTYLPVFNSGLRAAPLVDRGVMIGGAGVQGGDFIDIYTTSLGGLVATTLNGVPGITLGESATFAEFVIPVYVAPWEIAEYYASLSGSFLPGQIEMLASFDDGETFHEITPETSFPVTDSYTPGRRHLKIVMYSYHFVNGNQTGGSRPILTKIKEIFDQDGELGARTVLRFDVTPNETVKAVYMSDKGNITLSETVAPSEAAKCLLMKITPGVGAVAPAVKTYINKRRARIVFSKTKNTSDASTYSFDNNLAVIPTHVEAVGVTASDKHIYDIAEPIVNFDATVDVASGAAVANGDKWKCEVEG